MIAIIDYGVGNVGSIANMLKKIGAPSIITDNPAEIRQAGRIILPGVGAFDTAVTELEKRGLMEVLEEKAMQEQVPLLGICLGMQLLTEGSEEGSKKGFGWIPGRSYRFPAMEGLKVPHMQWNTIHKNFESPLFEGLDDASKFYFVHSYYVLAEDPAHAPVSATYGLSFHAAVQAGNIMGVQFHPEKSHKFGWKLLQNFTRI